MHPEKLARLETTVQRGNGIEVRRLLKVAERARLDRTRQHARRRTELAQSAPGLASVLESSVTTPEHLREEQIEVAIIKTLAELCFEKGQSTITWSAFRPIYNRTQRFRGLRTVREHPDPDAVAEGLSKLLIDAFAEQPKNESFLEGVPPDEIAEQYAQEVADDLRSADVTVDDETIADTRVQALHLLTDPSPAAGELEVTADMVRQTYVAAERRAFAAHLRSVLLGQPAVTQPSPGTTPPSA